MELLRKIAPALRSTGEGKALLTGWAGDGYDAAAGFQNMLNLELIVCCDRVAQEGLHLHHVNSVYGDFLGDIEGSHRRAP